MNPDTRDPQSVSRTGSFIFFILVSLVVLSPLPFGSIYQWSWASLSVIVGILLAVWALRDLFGLESRPVVWRKLWFPAALYMLVIVWIAIQASDLAPESWNNPVWADTARVLEEEVPGSISVNPYQSWSELLKMITYAGIFWLAVIYGRARNRAWGALWVIAVIGFGYAAYGLIAYLTDLGSTLWRHDMPRHSAGVTSVFVNRSMYAAYAGLGLLAATALLLNRWDILIETRSRGPVTRTGLLNDKESSIFLIVALCLVLLVALIMTASRGGVIGSFMAVATLFAIVLPRTRARESSTGWRSAGFVTAVLVVGLIVYTLAGDKLAMRIADPQSSATAARLAGYEVLLSAIAEAPLVGYGPGNTQDAFFAHNDGTLWHTFNYAHNLYIGAVVELGIPAAIALIGSVALVSLSCFKGVRRRRRDHVLPALGVSTTVLVATHGLVDSPIYLPASASTFSLILGIAYAQSWPTRRSNANSMTDSEPRPLARQPEETGEAQSE